MEFIYPDEYFSEFIEENLYNFNKETSGNFMSKIDLHSSVNESDDDYLKSIKEI